MRVTDHEIGKVSRLLDRTQGLGRTLETPQQVHDRTHDHKFGAQILTEIVPAPDHRAEEILQNRPHRDNQQHRSDDRQGLGPVGEGAVQVMVQPNEGIEHRQRPEPDHGQLMAVNGILDAGRQEIIDQHVTGRRNPQPDDVVQKQPVKGGVVNAGNGIGDHEAEQQVGDGPDQRRHQVPQRDVHRPDHPLGDRHDDLEGHDRDRREEHDVRDQRQLASLQALVVSQQKRDHADHQRGVPQPQQRVTPVRLVNRGAGQARQQVEHQAHEQGRECPEYHPVDMHGAQAAKSEVFILAQVFREIEHGRDGDPDRRGEH